MLDNQLFSSGRQLVHKVRHPLFTDNWRFYQLLFAVLNISTYTYKCVSTVNAMYLVYI